MVTIIRVMTQGEYYRLMSHLEQMGVTWNSGDPPTRLKYFNGEIFYVRLEPRRNKISVARLGYYPDNVPVGVDEFIKGSVKDNSKHKDRIVRVSTEEEYLKVVKVANKMGYEWWTSIFPRFKNLYDENTCVWFKYNYGKKNLWASSYGYALDTANVKVETFHEFMLENKAAHRKRDTKSLTSKAIKAIRNANT